MRRTDEKLNKFISKRMLTFRAVNGYSQECMAEKLDISVRSYWEQENCGCGFSGQTVCRFLSLLSDEEALEFVKGLRMEVWKEE